mmetsp:Transcript_43685/g.137152  ORF Transcript_43685/g.137152 Transcript_43685/m.137152 type:complete len:208 (-) Transcript_43685:765-1388(-)
MYMDQSDTSGRIGTTWRRKLSRPPRARGRRQLLLLNDCVRRSSTSRQRHTATAMSMWSPRWHAFIAVWKLTRSASRPLGPNDGIHGSADCSAFLLKLSAEAAKSSRKTLTASRWWPPRDSAIRKSFSAAVSSSSSSCRAVCMMSFAVRQSPRLAQTRSTAEQHSASGFLPRCSMSLNSTTTVRLSPGRRRRACRQSRSPGRLSRRDF